MKWILFVLVLLVLLWGCKKQPEPTTPPTTAPSVTTEPETTVPETTVPETTVPETTVPETTVPETTVPETTVPETTVPEPTEPEHSDLYLPQVLAEETVLWFREVCLDSEFLNYGDSCYLEKWTVPIAYNIHGAPTGEDLALIEDFSGWLNSIEGFPGIHPAENPSDANLQIHFTTEQEMLDLMGENFVNADGGFTYWAMEHEVYDAIICIRTDLDQYLRNSVILEELYNSVGARQDTQLRPDSIIYQDFTTPQELTEVDELILKLLYHPQMKCGMDAQACETMIYSLYY